MNGKMQAAAALAAAIAVSASHADFTSASLRAQGFNATDGSHKGEGLSAMEKMRVEAAIARLSAVSGSTAADCPDCLTKMLGKNRICKEGGTSTAGATTLPDKKAGCNETAEGIHLNKNFMSYGVDVLACILAHEWCHVNQTAADFAGNFEKPCYQHEVDCLVALGQSGTARHTQMVNCLAAQNAAPRTPPFDPGRDASGGEIVSGGSGFIGLSSEMAAISFVPYGSDFGLEQPLVAIVDPFDLELIEIPDFGEALFVSGLDANGNGVIEIFGSLGELFPIGVVPLPSLEPFSMAYDPACSTLYVLDTQQDVILPFLFDPFSPTNQLQPLPPFADPIQFPELAGALSIRLNTFGADDPSDCPTSLFVDHRDLRGRCPILLEDPRLILTDTTGNGQADQLGPPFFWRDHMAWIPGYVAPPFDGDVQVNIFAGTGSQIEIWETDGFGNPLAPIGGGLMPPNLNEFMLPLTRPLVGGEQILAIDVDNIVAVPPEPQLVEGGTTGCNAADLAPPSGILDIDDVITFLDAFATGDPLADLAPPPGVLDIDDVLTFLDAFASGCP